MEIPNELPVIYITPILIPGFILKIRLQIENNSNLLNYLLNTNSRNLIGIIPKTDIQKIDNVIGTVGWVRSVIQISQTSEEFFLVVQGICRFVLDAVISEKPLKINKICIINISDNLLGNEKQKNDLKAEFEKALIDLLNYSEDGILNPLKNVDVKFLFNKAPLHLTIEYCLKKFINLTPADAYEVLRATNLNSLMKFVIDWLKQETVKVNKYSKFEKTGLVPILPANFTHLIDSKNDINIKHNLNKQILPELKEIHTAILNSSMPTLVYDLVMIEFNKLQGMNTGHPDYSIFLNYLNYVVNLPWNKSTKETLNLEKAENVLQLNHFGMDKVKKRIIQFIAIKILKPEKRGPLLCLIGPPGVGKTSIANAIANSLNRTFKRISLGGINHYSDIKGHRRTYIGAMPGCIIQAISQSRTKNPIILLDEIDKMYKGSNGDPAAALLEVLDPEQNSTFVDSYVNLPFDLSQVMFISTANNVENIPRTLRDRMEIIYLKGYTLEEKVQIAENYLIPKIFKDNNISEVQITIPKKTIYNIINNYTYEAGVRELQRKLEEICYYIAVKIVENDKEIKNYLITPESLIDILDNEIYKVNNTLIERSCDRVGIAIGLSWTPIGGKVQVIEASKLYSRNRNNLVLTGRAGQTLNESVKIAFNWAQLFAEKNKLDISNIGVHVHLPEGGHKKDGPSAGITIVCALVSLFWNIPLKSMIAMTGEISLTGHVLPVGGVKEKILAAYNSNIRTVIIPELNLIDTKSLPSNVIEDLKIITVRNLEDVLEIVIPGGLIFLQNENKNMLPRSKI